ncbi:DedA family protein [bacterium]|jgi:membrane protein DedA with SNARE-associated domain|nr:DedA family protein [bacterium]MBT4598327.1 DedA family protein [bacterium]MBT6754160.1 DedA family protein [bacterium]MBT7993099.1 DedA family protein [bacterium]
MNPAILELIQQLQVWGYPIMLFLMIAEGPITTIIAAFLASLGFFDWYVVYTLSVFGDVLGDIFWYFVGFLGGRPVLKKFRKKLGIKLSTIRYLENKFEESGSKIIFYVKLSTGLCLVTFILAGSAKMKFGKFLQFSILGGLVWSMFLVALGYFFGELAEEIEKYIQFAGWAILSLAFFVFAFINLKKKKDLQRVINLFNKKQDKLLKK